MTTKDDKPTQQALLGNQSHKRGDVIIIGDVAWNFVKYSDDALKYQVERTVNDGLKSQQWIAVDTVDAADKPPAKQTPPPEQLTPETIACLIEMKKFVEINLIDTGIGEADNDRMLTAFDRALESLRSETKHIRQLEKELSDQTEETERQQTLVLVANRQTDVAKKEVQQLEEAAHTIRPVDPAEMQGLRTQIKSLEAEIKSLNKEQERPLVEVKSLVHKIDMREGLRDETQIAELLADGYELIGLPGFHYSKPEWTNFELERILFKRTNQQPIQPYVQRHGYTTGSMPASTLTEIDNNFDAQASRSNPIISQSGSALKQAGDAQAYTRARGAFDASKASHQPTSISKSINTILGSVNR